MEVYLIRHTTPNVQKGLCYGQSNIALNPELFESELALIKSKIPLDLDQYFTSPLSRCLTLTKALSKTFVVDNNLIELNFGNWEMKHWNNIKQKESDYWTKDFVNAQTPNGESYLDLHLRTQQFIQSLYAFKHQKIAVITHAGKIRSFISYCLNLDLKDSFKIALDYGAVVKIRLDINPELNQLITIG